MADQMIEWRCRSIADSSCSQNVSPTASSHELLDELLISLTDVMRSVGLGTPVVISSSPHPPMREDTKGLRVAGISFALLQAEQAEADECSVDDLYEDLLRAGLI